MCNLLKLTLFFIKLFLIKEVNTYMALYIAMRVTDKLSESVEAAKAYYKLFLSHKRYSKYKEEVDAILIADGHENLISEI